ncbi:MAG: hypothetical protein COA43_10895 [Robiginitomaculum sp.]|nr:MAG: hypothetical protein COA43_10895 [Robiginitomaculum sp.]
MFADKNKKDKGSNQARSKEDESRSVYNGYEEDRGRRRISGATLRAKADLTHPLLFGFNRTHIPVFYNARKVISKAKISYDTPLIFAKQELLMTGYADKKQIEKLEGTPVIAVHRVGKGKIVAVNTDANFRAFWIGTERLFANTLFFTQAIDSRKDEG